MQSLAKFETWWRILRPPYPPMVAPVATFALAAVATGYIAQHDPSQPGHYPTCPWLVLSGWYCPGCGTLRALHALTQLDIEQALRYNALTICVAMPILVSQYSLWVWRQIPGDTAPPRRPHSRAIWALLALVLAFGVLRNIPAFGFLAPGGM